MRIISFIEDAQVIREILMHLGLWLVRSRPPPKIHDPPNIEYAAADLQLQPLNNTIYGDETDPLICPICKGIMRIISFIKEHQIIRDILDHLGVWLVKARPTPKIHDPPIREFAAVDHQRKINVDDFCGDPNYSWDEYIRS
jgi:hypothetical protein